MTSTVRCYQLKDKAKDSLLGKYAPAVRLCFLSALIPFCAELLFDSLITPLVPSPDYSSGFTMQAFLPSFCLSAVVSYVLSILVGILHCGVALFFLNVACGQKFGVQDLFYGVHESTDKILTISAVRATVNVLCLIPLQLFGSCYYLTKDEKWILPFFIAALAGLCIFVPVSLSLEMSYYLLLDYPEQSPLDILKLSCHVMKGRKWKLFLLQVSFLPLSLLGVLSFYIGFLWIKPYMQMTYTQFFLSAMSENND